MEELPKVMLASERLQRSYATGAGAQYAVETQVLVMGHLPQRPQRWLRAWLTMISKTWHLCSLVGLS